jgi:hypothetical protein
MGIITSPVRKARREEADELLEMCKTLHAENGQFSFCERKIRDQLEMAFSRNGAVIGVIGQPGRLEASICMSLSSYYYTDDIHLGERWNFVLPQYRKSTNAKELIKFGMLCAEELGIPFITGVISNERTEAKLRLYRRLLGDPVGGFFIYRPARAGANAA